MAIRPRAEIIRQGGAAAIHGFLYQVCGSLDALTNASFSKRGTSVDITAITARLEPSKGGDLIVASGAETIVIQFKHRTRKIDAAAFSAKIIPDLYRAHCDAPADEYRLASTIGVNGSVEQLLHSAATAISAGAKDLRDFRELGEARGNCRKIYQSGSRPDELFEEDFAAFLGRVAIAPPRPLDEIEAGLLAQLRKRHPYPELVQGCLEQLIGHLFIKASENDTLISRDEILALLELPDPVSGTPEANLNRMMSGLEKALEKRRYSREVDVREAIAPSNEPVTLVIGESGYGKSWRLYRSAYDSHLRRRPAVLVTAPNRPDLERQLQEAIGIAYLKHRRPIQAKLLGETWRDARDIKGENITIFWEGCRNAADLEAIEMEGGLGDGLILIAECPVSEPRDGGLRDCPTITVDQFSSDELFETLKRRKIDAGLIPHEIRRMLKLPVLCGLYAAVAAENTRWTPQNEYRVLAEFWKRSQKRQHAGPYACAHLTMIARSLVAARRASISGEELIALGVSAGNLNQLVDAGWLSSAGARWSFAHDRLLTWAIAQALVQDLLTSRLDTEGLISSVEILRGPRAKGGEILAGLGFLLMDVVWLLSAEHGTAENLASLLQAFEPEDRIGPHILYNELLPTIGAAAIPALIERARTLTDISDAQDVHVAACLIAISRGGVNLEAAIDTLWRMDGGAGRSIATLVGGQIPLLDHRGDLWADVRRHFSKQADTTSDGLALQWSDAAMRCAVRAEPNWLSAAIEKERDPDALWIAANIMGSIDAAAGQRCWSISREILFSHIPPNRHGILIENIGRFGSKQDTPYLIENIERDAGASPWAFQILAGFDADAALSFLERHPNFAVSPPGRAWIDHLLDHDDARTRAALFGWLEVGDASGGHLAAIWSRAEDRVDGKLLRYLLEKLYAALAQPESNGLDPVPALVGLLGSLTLNPCHDRIFRGFQDHELAQLLEARAIAQIEEGGDAAYVGIRRVLRRIGGPSYERMILHALTPEDLEKAQMGIKTSIFRPTPAILERLEQLLGLSSSGKKGTDERFDLWTQYLSMAPERGRSRLLALLDSDRDEDILLALRLLETFRQPGDLKHVLRVLDRSASRSEIEAQAMTLVSMAGPVHPSLTSRAIALLGKDAGDATQVACLNVLLQDRSRAAREALDAHLEPLATAKSFGLYEIRALEIRLRQGKASDRLWEAGRKMSRESLFGGTEIIDLLVRHDPRSMKNLLLDRAFSTPHVVTNVQPHAINTLATLDLERATNAFIQSWQNFPDRRDHLAHVSRALGKPAYEVMVNHLAEDFERTGGMKLFRKACVELRRAHETTRQLLIDQYHQSKGAERLALLSAIGWMPASADLLYDLAGQEPDLGVRRTAQDVARRWQLASDAVDQFRASPSLETMEYAIDISEPEPLYMWGDSLRILEPILQDSRLTHFAEQQFTRRMKALTGSGLWRIRIRPRPANE
ncbi:MAG: hypothetical protein JHD35_16455 [Sphingopyxis sp.]|nr:hypothetical protein [Sphingopyxis sp.]